MEWQRIRGDEWVFGEKIRGVVRFAVAEVYFDAGLPGGPYGWVWFCRIKDDPIDRHRGISNNLQQAVADAEEELERSGFVGII